MRLTDCYRLQWATSWAGCVCPAVKVNVLQRIVRPAAGALQHLSFAMYECFIHTLQATQCRGILCAVMCCACNRNPADSIHLSLRSFRSLSGVLLYDRQVVNLPRTLRHTYLAPLPSSYIMPPPGLWDPGLAQGQGEWLSEATCDVYCPDLALSQQRRCTPVKVCGQQHCLGPHVRMSRYTEPALLLAASMATPAFFVGLFTSPSLSSLQLII
jgi:hypothetical protein